MKKLIKSSQTNRFKNVSRIVYSYGGYRDRMVYTPDKTSYDSINVWIRKKTEEVSILKMIERQVDAENDSFQLNAAGKRYDLESGDQDNCPVLSFLPMNKASAIESIHNCLFNFFGDSIEYHWVARDHKLFIPPPLQNVSVCLSIENLDNV
ncbi:hypothetical protein B9Z55_009044 [Caenorhabditis nigoni]|nr:hypothetical protein B9Z55_009044 [Caenorhabditis nigoni]